jgi:hypothetical protein
MSLNEVNEFTKYPSDLRKQCPCYFVDLRTNELTPQRFRRSEPYFVNSFNSAAFDAFTVPNKNVPPLGDHRRAPTGCTTSRSRSTRSQPHA